MSLWCLHCVSRISAVPPLHLYLTLVLSAVSAIFSNSLPSRSRDNVWNNGSDFANLKDIPATLAYSLAYPYIRILLLQRFIVGLLRFGISTRTTFDPLPSCRFADYPSTHSDLLEALGHFISRCLTEATLKRSLRPVDDHLALAALRPNPTSAISDLQIALFVGFWRTTDESRRSATAYQTERAASIAMRN